MTVLFAVFLIWLVVAASQGNLDRGDKMASIVSMTIAAATLPTTVLALVMMARQQARSTSTTAMSQRLDSTAKMLADAVRAQWEAEEQIRRIHDPFPLQPRWTNAADNLVDYWQSIYGTPDRRDPITLEGRGDEILQTFDRVPSRRLVLLGRAGAGKTILASRFTLGLIARRTPTDHSPVPVIFSFGSWNPTANSLRDWLGDQIIRNYPTLAEDEAGTTVAYHLLATGRVMPVLDGFDEIPEGLRADAVNGISASFRPGDNLILTSRPEEYAAAVTACDVLTATAVIEIKDLTIDDLAGYLPLTARKGSEDSAHGKWRPVLDYLYNCPTPTALATVLATPLMVGLARTIFSDTDANPAELINPKLPNDIEHRTGLEDRLLAGFIPAAYSRHSHHYRPTDRRQFDCRLPV